MPFEATQMPRACVVSDSTTHEVLHTFDRIEDAESYAAALNRWEEAMPRPDGSFRHFVLPPEPTEADLLDILDRMLDPERRADLAIVGIRRTLQERHERLDQS